MHISNSRSNASIQLQSRASCSRLLMALRLWLHAVQLLCPSTTQVLTRRCLRCCTLPKLPAPQAPPRGLLWCSHQEALPVWGTPCAEALYSYAPSRGLPGLYNTLLTPPLSPPSIPCEASPYSPAPFQPQGQLTCWCCISTSRSSSHSSSRLSESDDATLTTAGLTPIYEPMPGTPSPAYPAYPLAPP